MKISLTFKTPSVVDEQRLKEDIALYCPGPDLGPDEECLSCSEELNKAKQLIDQFIKYDEVVSIEFDTDTGTATVLKAR